VSRGRYFFVVTAEAIIAYVAQLVREFAPQRVLLFGSYASGAPTADSDVDLLVVADIPSDTAQAAAEAAAEMRRRTTHPFPLDLLVRTPVMLRQRLEWNDGFIADIVDQGIVLHDTADERVGAEGRRRLRGRLARVAVA
jgi:predicted nucleotidyltransferase